MLISLSGAIEWKGWSGWSDGVEGYEEGEIVEGWSNGETELGRARWWSDGVTERRSGRGRDGGVTSGGV